MKFVRGERNIIMTTDDNDLSGYEDDLEPQEVPDMGVPYPLAEGEPQDDEAAE